VVSENVPKVSKDTLVLWGENDEILDPKTAFMFQEVLKSCSLKLIENCGHVPHLEKPQETAEEILNFIRKGS
jgi:pimeloyl-ACP methyl ester carboxylesterase